MSGTTFVELEGIRKEYPGVRALDGVDLAVRRGEIHALVGENGAGKSTLLKVLAGVIRPDAGAVVIDGKRTLLDGPRAARSFGIAAAHQDADLFPSRSAVENCFVQARLPGRALISWPAARAAARAALARLADDFPDEAPVEMLTASRRQVVSLAGALIARPRVLVLDEPTASLSAADAGRLFAVLRELRAEGAGIVYVSHRLGEVLALADRVTVLRDGRVIRTNEAGRLSTGALIEAMVGRRLESYYPRPPGPPAGEPALMVAGLTDPAGAFRDVSFSVRRGEVLGLYGLIGAGRSEIAQAVAGLRRARGSVHARGRVAYLPEDRLREGNLPGLSLRENLTASALVSVLRGPLVPGRAERRLAASLRDRLSIRAAGLEAGIETLSGGNQQKALLGRWLAVEPEVLILDEPTQGVDVGAKGEIHEIVSGLARAGRAVVLVSSDLPEVLGMSHRVLVVRDGRVAAEIPSAAASEEEVARAAFPAEAARDPAEGEVRGRSRRRPLALPGREAALALAALAVACATAIESPAFLSLASARDVAADTAALALGAMAETLVIASGAIDISIGPMLALSATAAALAAGATGSVPAAVLLACLLGTLLGCINAGISIAGRLHPIITTLGTLGIFQGAFILWTGGEWIDLPVGLASLAAGGPLGIPASVWAVGLAAAALFAFLGWTRAGRACLNAGDNPRAAVTHGLPVARTRLLAFALLGALVGLAGVFHTARFGRVQSSTGAGFELLAIAAAVLGGARVTGGRGTVPGALLGALLIGLLQNARSVWGIHERWQLVTVGALMLGALAIEAAAARVAAARGWRGP
jgi:ABC-type sugar transport system ATPase subunit/ribose/xylose/arabinose/galactoside ABC-type transport system permease subunit